jgi:hypothetical protein
MRRSREFIYSAIISNFRSWHLREQDGISLLAVAASTVG